MLLKLKEEGSSLATKPDPSFQGALDKVLLPPRTNVLRPSISGDALLSL